ncbi:MAG: hypothetical protein QGG24_01670 [Vicinamibacterales bacterium]|jgi:hypothetical protein|nr:hypothetical protein [Vicinamibacterales bacterium]MDP7472741.1 hypothetical protein [Vicinamibacterales bacterium]MDP7671843.1 hypothetical protein [Vicinamibacterales bacterium]HJO38641.1 hypothetical protein [Vicinamibacterales bacterium]
MRFDAILAATVLTAACGSPDPGAAAGPALVNDDYQIARMATADDVLVIEIDATAEVDPEAVARTLVEPVMDRYPEVTVYVRWPETGRPTVKVSWTAEDGYSMLALE